MLSFYGQNYSDIIKIFEENNLHKSGVSLLFNWHYKKKEIIPCHKDLAITTQEFIKKNFHFQLPEIIKASEAEDTTVKLLFRLDDGNLIESVIIPFISKYTLCLSTQVGCAMNCSFCFTGTLGLTRHLRSEEIIGQFIMAARWLKEHRPQDEFKRALKNIVFMGQGEPLHNFDHVKKACEIFLEPKGLCLGIQKITLSTAGHLPGLERFLNEMPKINIALSLHALSDEIREKLIPINKRYPIKNILELLEKIPLARKQYIIYEYLLIKDLNDCPHMAMELGKYFKGKKAIINLIPFNPFPGTHYERPEGKIINEFQKIIESFGVPALIRTTKGDDILAACGQLVGRETKK